MSYRKEKGLTLKRAKKCVTHHAACDCREYKYEQMEQALREIRTWGAFDKEGKWPDPELKPAYVIKLCSKGLMEGNEDNG